MQGINREFSQKETFLAECRPGKSLQSLRYFIKFPTQRNREFFNRIRELNRGNREHQRTIRRTPSVPELVDASWLHRSDFCALQEILAESGVDLLLCESTGGTTHRKWVLEACLATGLPVWVGFKCHQDTASGTPKVGYHSDEPLAASFEQVVTMGGSVVTIFHSPIAATDAALPLVRSHWKGPIGIYPEAERKDYVAVHRDANEPDHVSPEEFVAKAKDWVSRGVQIIGGCCGIELEHIQPLRAALPKRLQAET